MPLGLFDGGCRQLIKYIATVVYRCMVYRICIFGTSLSLLLLAVSSIMCFLVVLNKLLIIIVLFVESLFRTLQLHLNSVNRKYHSLKFNLGNMRPHIVLFYLSFLISMTTSPRGYSRSHKNKPIKNLINKINK